MKQFYQEKILKPTIKLAEQVGIDHDKLDEINKEIAYEVYEEQEENNAIERPEIYE